MATPSRSALDSWLAGLLGGMFGGALIVVLIALLWAWVFRPQLDAATAEPASYDARDYQRFG